MHSAIERPSANSSQRSSQPPQSAQPEPAIDFDDTAAASRGNRSLHAAIGPCHAHGKLPLGSLGTA
jgi:hypothetical protein